MVGVRYVRGASCPLRKKLQGPRRWGVGCKLVSMLQEEKPEADKSI